MAGPQEQRLTAAVSGMSVEQVRTAAQDWADGAAMLDIVVTALKDCGPDIEKNFGGETAEAAKAAFAKVTERVEFRSSQMTAAGTALNGAGDALYYAGAVKDGMGSYPAKPAEPTTSPADDEVASIRKHVAYGRQLSTYNTQTAEREATAKQTADHLERVLTHSTDTMKQVHGDPDRPGGPTQQQTTTGGGTTSAGTTRPHVPTTTVPHVFTDTTRPPQPTVHTPQPTDTNDPTGPGDTNGPGSPQGPTGPVVTTPGGPTTPGATTPGTTTPGGVTAPTLGGVAGALGGGALGGLAGVGGAVRGPSVVPGGMTAGGPRTIGGVTRSSAASGGALGRGAGVGSAGGTRGSGRGSTGAGGSGAAGSGRTGSRTGTKGKAGSRGAGAGTGRGGRNTKDDERKDDEFFLEEQDWVDDESTAPGVLD